MDGITGAKLYAKTIIVWFHCWAPVTLSKKLTVHSRLLWLQVAGNVFCHAGSFWKSAIFELATISKQDKDDFQEAILILYVDID